MQWIKKRGRALAARTQQTIAAVTLRRCIALAVALCALAVLAEPAMAALPTAVDPGGGAASGDFMGLIKEYYKEGMIVVGLLITATGFMVVAHGGIGKFNDYRKGKAELGDVGIFGIAGVLLIVVIVYLVTQGSGIIT